MASTGATILESDMRFHSFWGAAISNWFCNIVAVDNYWFAFRPHLRAPWPLCTIIGVQHVSEQVGLCVATQTNSDIY